MKGTGPTPRPYMRPAATRHGSARPDPRLIGRRKLRPRPSMQRAVRLRPARLMMRGSKRSRMRGDTR